MKTVAFPAIRPRILDSGKSLIGLKNIAIPITIKNMHVKWSAWGVISPYLKLGGISKINPVAQAQISKIPTINPMYDNTLKNLVISNFFSSSTFFFVNDPLCFLSNPS